MEKYENKSDTSVESYISKVSYENLTNNKIPLDGEANILLIDNKRVYYYIDELNSLSQDLSNQALYYFDIASGQTGRIGIIESIAGGSGSVAMLGEKILLPLAKQGNQNVLFQIKLETESIEIAKQWTAFPPLSYVYSTEKEFIIFGPDVIDHSLTRYYIDKIDISNGQQDTIIESFHGEEGGTLISCVDIDQNNIYTYTISGKDKEESYAIFVYDFNGKKKESYALDLKKSLKNEDVVVNLYKFNEFFILNTLNGCNYIFQKTEDALKELKTPDVLFKNGGYRVIESYDGEIEEMYFMNTFHDSEKLIIFSHNASFHTIEFPKYENMSYSFYRNARGDLLVKKIAGDNLEKKEFFLIDNQSLNKWYKVS